MEKEENKTIAKHYCGKCNEELRLIGSGFDTFSFFDPAVQRYCSNAKCSRYGVVTVASILQEITN